jgi:hypothetical protein
LGGVTFPTDEAIPGGNLALSLNRSIRPDASSQEFIP